MDSKLERWYAEDNENWRDEVGSREEFNAYIDYKAARAAGKSHEEAIASADEGAEADAKFKAATAGRLGNLSEQEIKHRESLDRSAANVGRSR